MSLRAERPPKAERKRGITIRGSASPTTSDAAATKARDVPPPEQASSGTERRPLVKAPATRTAKSTKTATTAAKGRSSQAKTPAVVSKAAAKTAAKAVVAKKAVAKPAAKVTQRQAGGQNAGRRQEGGCHSRAQSCQEGRDQGCRQDPAPKAAAKKATPVAPAKAAVTAKASAKPAAPAVAKPSRPAPKPVPAPTPKAVAKAPAKVSPPPRAAAPAPSKVSKTAAAPVPVPPVPRPIRRWLSPHRGHWANVPPKR